MFSYDFTINQANPPKNAVINVFSYLIENISQQKQS